MYLFVRILHTNYLYKDLRDEAIYCIQNIQLEHGPQVTSLVALYKFYKNHHHPKYNKCTKREVKPLNKADLKVIKEQVIANKIVQILQRHR